MLEVSRRRRRLTFAALEHPSRFLLLLLLLLLLAAAAYTRTELNLTVINLDFITAGVVTTSIHVLCSTCIALHCIVIPQFSLNEGDSEDSRSDKQNSS
jgi:hypothetical protein